MNPEEMQRQEREVAARVEAEGGIDLLKPPTGESVSRRNLLKLGGVGAVASVVPLTGAGTYTNLVHPSYSYFTTILYATGTNGTGRRHQLDRGQRGLWDCDSVYVYAPTNIPWRQRFVYVFNGYQLFCGNGWVNTKWWFNIKVHVRPFLIGDEPFTL